MEKDSFKDPAEMSNKEFHEYLKALRKTMFGKASSLQKEQVPLKCDYKDLNDEADITI